MGGHVDRPLSNRQGCPRFVESWREVHGWAILRAVPSSSPRVVFPSQRVLGIDPGTRKLGWGVVERRAGRLSAVAAGVIVLGSEDSLRDRIHHAFEQVEAMIEDHAPDVVAVEDIFYAKYANAAIKLGHVRGVILLAAARADRQVTEWPPALVKRTIAGRGAADKEQVARLVATALKLRTLPPIDAADALAIAMTHLASIAPIASARTTSRASGGPARQAPSGRSV